MIKNPESGIDIAGAGYGERMQQRLIELGLEPTYPKLLLPTGGPNGETLAGRIVRQSLTAPIEGPTVLHANVDTYATIEAHPDIDTRAHVTTVEHGNTFRPFVNKLLEHEVRVHGSHADYYADFSWSDFLDAHESNPYPVTFAVARSVPIERGAVFTVDDLDRITGFTRTEQTDGTELLNMGAYIFDPDKAVIRALQDTIKDGRMASEEVIVKTLIARQLAGAYIMPNTFFNINIPPTYDALLAHTSSIDTNLEGIAS